MAGDLWTCENDDRTVPTDDNTRLPAFKTGWTEGVKHNEGSDIPSKYRDEPSLDTLTWDNLGFRLGIFFGETNDDLREELYEWCRKEQKE